MRDIICALLAAMLAWPVTARTERVNVRGAVGSLSAILQTPALGEGEKCPMVMLLHGFMGNKEGSVERDMAERLEKAGIATIRFDFNGHGESEGEFRRMTVLNEIEDARLVYEYVSRLPYVSRIGVSGHSQGGVVASMLAGDLGEERVACVVLFAPAAVLREDAIRGSTMGAMYDPLDPPEYVELFGGKRLGREYIKTAFSLPIYETAARYTGPACVIHGTGDRVVPYTYGERYHQIWPGSELHILEGFDHGFSQDLPKAARIAEAFLVARLKAN